MIKSDLDNLFTKVEEEHIENEEIHSALLIGRDPGKRSSIKMHLRYMKVVQDMIDQVADYQSTKETNG